VAVPDEACVRIQKSGLCAVSRKASCSPGRTYPVGHCCYFTRRARRAEIFVWSAATVRA